MNSKSKYNKILVTGAAGFIGHALCKKLIQDGHTVVGLDNINAYYSVDLKYARLKDLGVEREEAKEFGELCRSNKHEKLSFVRMNIEDRDALPQLFKAEQFKAVINLAAQAGVRYSLENPETYIDSNITGFLNVLEACRHHEIKHLVYASSSSVYGENKKVPFEETDRVDHPVSLYAATKKSNELMAYTYSHLYNLPVSGLRFFTVYGPWGRPDMAPMLFASAITENQPIKVFNHGDMRRDFTYIDDIVEGIVITLNNPAAADNQPLTLVRSEQTAKSQKPKANNQLFNIGNGSPVHLMEFIETLEQALGKKANKNMMPMQPGDVPQTYASTEELEKLGYKSKTDIQKGVSKFVEWFKNYKK